MSKDLLVDFFELDLTKNNGDWVGNNSSAETSACANYLNFQPFEFYFTPDGVDTISWFTDDVYRQIDIPVASFEQYLSFEIINKGFSIAFIDSDLDSNSVLTMEIGLLNNEIITIVNGVV